MSVMQQNNSAAMNKVGENYSDVQQYSASDSEVTQNNMSSSDPESSVDHDYDAEQDQEGNTHVAFPADNARKAGMGCWVKVAIVVALVVIAIGIALVVTFVCVFDNKHHDDSETSGNVVTTSASGVTTPNQTGGGDSDTTTPSSPTDVTTSPAPVDVCSINKAQNTCTNKIAQNQDDNIYCTWLEGKCVKNGCAYITDQETCNKGTTVRVEEYKCKWARLTTWTSNKEDDKKQASFLTIVGDDAPTLVVSADSKNATTAAVATTSVTDGTSSANSSTTPAPFVCGVSPCAYFGSETECTSLNASSENDIKCSWNPPSTDNSYCSSLGNNEPNCKVLNDCVWNKDNGEVATCQAIVKDVGKCVDYKTPVAPSADDSCGAKSSEAEKWNPVNWAKCGFTGNWRAWVLSGTTVLALIYAVVAIVKREVNPSKWGNKAVVEHDAVAEGDEALFVAPEKFNIEMLHEFLAYLSNKAGDEVDFVAGLKEGIPAKTDITTLSKETLSKHEDWAEAGLDINAHLTRTNLEKWAEGSEHYKHLEAAHFDGYMNDLGKFKTTIGIEAI